MKDDDEKRKQAIAIVKLLRASKLACFFDIIASPNAFYSDSTVYGKPSTAILREMSVRGHRITKSALPQSGRANRSPNNRGNRKLPSF